MEATPTERLQNGCSPAQPKWLYQSCAGSAGSRCMHTRVRGRLCTVARHGGCAQWHGTGIAREAAALQTTSHREAAASTFGKEWLHERQRGGNLYRQR